MIYYQENNNFGSRGGTCYLFLKIPKCAQNEPKMWVHTADNMYRLLTMSTDC